MRNIETADTFNGGRIINGLASRHCVGERSLIFAWVLITYPKFLIY